MDEKVEYKKTNREKRRTPSRGAGFCRNCDRWIVPPGVRCHCGYVQPGKRRNKKE